MPDTPTAKISEVLKTLDTILLIRALSPCAKLDDSSGTSKEEKEPSTQEGKSKIGITIPCKTPYEDSAIEEFNPLFLSPQGIHKCSIVTSALLT